MSWSYTLFVFLFLLHKNVFSIVPLSSYVSISLPYLQPFISGDDQHLPLYVSCKPAEFVFNMTSSNCELKSSTTIPFPSSLKSAGESQLQTILTYYEGMNISMIELWPTLGAFGFYTWVYARIFHNQTHWVWLNSSEIMFPSAVDSPLDASEYPEPFLPRLLQTSNNDDYSEIFTDMMSLPSLYQKPVFSDCLWTSSDYISSFNETQRTTIYPSWLALEAMNEIKQKQHHNICVVLPQPFQMNGKAHTLFINITSNNIVQWPSDISWYTVSSPLSTEILKAKPTSDDWYKYLQWPKTFANSWTSDMYQLSGVEPIEYENKTKMHLTRKSSAQSDNQLLAVIDYLIERYRKLNIRTEKQVFEWRNITQANLIAYLPAGSSRKCQKPVVFIDHIDTAFEEDTFYETGRRQTTQGADDNVSGLVALLLSASILKQTQEKACRDVWLVHMTGEEYPAASLGVSHFLQQLFLKNQPIYTAVIVDMIAHRVNQSDPIIQVNAGDSTQSLVMANLALNYVYPKIKKDLILKNLQPVLRRWSDPYAYLYNTDGVRLVEYGFTCLLFNEHINYHENFYRDGYHDTLDTVNLIDWEYGQTISQYAIATVSMLAHSDCPSDSQKKRSDLVLISALVFKLCVYYYHYQHYSV